MDDRARSTPAIEGGRDARQEAEPQREGRRHRAARHIERPAQGEGTDRGGVGGPSQPQDEGKTPEATVAAQLYTAAKSGKPVTTLDGTEGVIVKADRGLLAFKKSLARRSAA